MTSLDRVDKGLILRTAGQVIRSNSNFRAEAADDYPADVIGKRSVAAKRTLYTPESP